MAIGSYLVAVFFLHMDFHLAPDMSLYMFIPFYLVYKLVAVVSCELGKYWEVVDLQTVDVEKRSMCSGALIFSKLSICRLLRLKIL